VEGEEAARLGELRALLALPTDAALDVTGDLTALARQSVELPEAPPERPDVTALAEELEEARAELRLAQAAAWPDVSLGVRYELEGNESAIVGGLSVPLPLFSRGQQGRVTGSARVRLLEQALESARRVRDAQVEAALAQYRKNGEALETLEREALPLLTENESLARKSYEAGEMGLVEFLLVRREVLDARADYLDRQLEAALSRAHLAAQAGVLR
jgi:cobalt-zinc-cadmium efflux system outer membrane protein